VCSPPGSGRPTSERLVALQGHPPVARPSLCPGPMLQGVSYVHHANLYIRNIIPIRAPAGLSRVQSKPLPGRARISHPPARPDLFFTQRRGETVRKALEAPLAWPYRPP
jgi:hypothetical protein